MSDKQKSIVNSSKEALKFTIDKMQGFFSRLPQNLKKKLYSAKTRFFIVVLMMFINLYNYKHIKQRYSKKNCINFIIKLGCSDTYYYLIFLVLLIDILFLYYLEKNISIASFPKYWWLFMGIICIMLAINMEDKTELVEKDGTFNPPPLQSRRYFGRTFWTLLSLLLSCLSLVIELINKKSNFKYIIGLRLTNTILLLIIYYYTVKFAACKYNLPDSWRS